jgi:hypothetical protein
MPRANVAVVVWMPLFMYIHINAESENKNITVGKHGYKYKIVDI